MSESHDIEQIARVIDPDLWDRFEEYSRRWNSTAGWETRKLPSMEAAARILPLLASAREEGARDMRERAADQVEYISPPTVRNIQHAIRALPTIKEG